ncbi:MAG: chondroitinase family polysaccharide lyase [Paludibacter sp.]|nr:chondroitinase family polysaccharide lyase [Paludibacter sp.]
MRKLTTLLLFAIILVLPLSAQTFNFEDASVPSDWSVSGEGTLSLSTEHYKEGNTSLCWETNGTGALTVSFPSFTASTGNSALLQIYTPEFTSDTLVIEFFNNSYIRRTANYLLNYKGWREFNRAYTEYISNTSFTLTSIRISLKPASEGIRKIYFDDVKLNQSTEANRIIGTQWVLDKEYFTSNISQLNWFANPVDIPLETPTASELNALNALRNQLSRTPAAGNTTNLDAAKSFATNMNITRNPDGTVRGNVVDMSVTALTTAVVTDYVNKLEMLAAEGLNDAPTLALFRDLLDHLVDQGFAEGVSFSIRSNDYTASRNIPSKLLNLLPACTPEQKTEVLKLVRWISYYGMFYDPESSYLQLLNSDVLYLYLPHMMGVALFQQEDAVAVRELKAFKRFLERNTEYVPGGGDILKPDGTGFHHGTHYNNYMYSYQTWAEYISYLKGTPFRISLEAYERFKKAVLAIYTMATLNTNNTRHYANTLSGRNPFASGIQIFFSAELFENLIGVGGDILGKDIDEELAGAYNYFFKSTKYSVPEKSYEGFHQFNYSPMGIYRKDNWVATMRAPTTKTWGAEIYSKENRFGRYQSHGTLEITYSGTAVASGYPGNTNGGGWDWNVVPGTTTVHYTSWQEMMPNKNVTDRFDQYTKTKNFSGALSWNNCGIFATDFDQIDIWGSQRFTPTNLVFKKSMFAFDGIIISLGSNISSSGTYSTSMITATNLFQNITSSGSGAMILNGAEIARPNTVTLPSGQDNWMITPQGTGYFIPQGNDEIKLIHDTQKTPYETGSDYASPVTSANAAKAYIKHGVKPTGKKYSFVVVPATNSAAMQSLSSQMANNGGSVYQVHTQNEYLHALTYKPENITAYTFFGASFNLAFGIVKSSTGGHLLMHRPDEVTGRQFFAASNPNLKPVSDAVFGWKSSTTQATLTIAGEWLPLQNAEGVQFHNPSNGETQLTLTFNDGQPLYFALKRLDDTGVDITTKNDWITFYNDRDFLWLIPSEELGPDTIVSIYSSVGKLVFQSGINTGKVKFSVPVSDWEKGLYICKVQVPGKKTAVFKWVK